MVIGKVLVGKAVEAMTGVKASILTWFKIRLRPLFAILISRTSVCTFTAHAVLLLYAKTDHCTVLRTVHTLCMTATSMLVCMERKTKT